MRRLSGFAVFLVLGPGCAQTDPLAKLAGAGNQGLGIAEFQIMEAPSEVVIVAFDAAKKEVGRIEVTAGKFVRTEGFGKVGEVDGHRLTIDYKGVKQEHQSQGIRQSDGSLAAIKLPTIFGGAKYAPLDAFVRDPHVRPVLAKYGIEFQGDAPIVGQHGEEVAYDNHTYYSCNGGGGDYGTGDPSADTCNRDAASRMNRAQATTRGVAMITDYDLNVDEVVFTCDGGAIANGHQKAHWVEAKYCCRPRSNGCTIPGTGGLVGGQVGCAILWGPEEINGDDFGYSVSAPNPSDYPNCGGAPNCVSLGTNWVCGVAESVWANDDNSCVPLTFWQACSDQGKTCGTSSNGCGGTYSCGTCLSGWQCQGTSCTAVCGDGQCAQNWEDCNNCPEDCGLCTDGSGLYQGCFVDSGSRALPVFAGDRGDMTPALCRALCAGWAYAGVQYYGQCFCGNTLQYEQRPNGECNTPCNGNNAVACGGPWRNSIYSAGGCGDQGCGCGQPPPNECGCSGQTDQGCGCGAGPPGACGCSACGGGDVVFYWDIWYNGASFSAGGNVDFVGWNWNDQISSIHIPSGRAVVLYQDWYYGGDSIYLTGDIPDLRDYGWNDWASSIAIY